jgi:hypothetical protein
MPPRISSDRGVPRRGRPSRGDHPGGGSRGSRLGGPSSINTGAAIPNEISDSNIPSAIGGRPSGNHGRGRGRGSSHGDAPGSPPSTATTPVIEATTTTASITSLSQSISSAQIPAPVTTSHPTAFRGQPSGNRGRGGVPDSHSSTSTPPSTLRGQVGNRGRGRGRGASRGGAHGAPSGFETATPITGETAPLSAIRGQPSRGHASGGYRGSHGARGSPFGSPSSFRGYSSRGGGGGAGRPSDITGSPSGVPGKSYHSTKNSTSCVYLSSFFINPRSNIADDIITFGAKRPGYGTGGRAVKIIINAFSTTIPDIIIYQYDGEIPF